MNTDRVMRWSGRRAYVYGWFYRRWSILIHRYGYHHTRTLYPADEKGVTAILKCDWCGLSAARPKTTARILAEHREATK